MSCYRRERVAQTTEAHPNDKHPGISIYIRWTSSTLLWNAVNLISSPVNWSNKTGSYDGPLASFDGKRDSGAAILAIFALLVLTSSKICP